MLMRVFALLLVVAAVGPAWGQSNQELKARYLAILKKNPTSETALSRLWELHFADGETKALLDVLTDLAGQEPTAHLALAEVYEKASQLEAARSQISQAAKSSFEAPAWIRLGRLAGRLGMKAEALDAWKKAAASAPENLAVRTAIGKAAMQDLYFSDAIPHWQYVANHGNPTEKLEALQALMQCAEKSGNLPLAAESAIRALNLTSVDHWMHEDLLQSTIEISARSGTLQSLEETWKDKPLHCAALARSQNDVEQEAAWLQKALQSDPTNPRVGKALAAAQIRLRQWSSAEQSLRSVMRQQPEDESTVESLATLLANQGREEEAASVINDFYRKNPSSRRMELLNALHLNKALEEALREEFRKDPRSEKAALALAAAQIDRGKFEEAKKTLAALELSTLDAADRLEASLRVAGFLVDRQMYEAAESWARTAKKISPTSPEATLQLSEILEMRGNPEGALTLLLEAAPSSSGSIPQELDQRLISAMQRRDAATDLALKNLSARAFAEEIMESARKRSSAELWARGALWCSWIGESKVAVNCLRAAMDLNPSDADALDRLAIELEKLGDIEAALQTLDQLARMKPSPELDAWMARLEIHRGNPDAAVALLTRSVNEHPVSPELTRELARAQEAAGQNFDALETWLRAFEMASSTEKSNLLKPLLSSFTRLGLKDRGMEFLKAGMGKFQQPQEILELLKSGAAFAKENQRLPQWKELLLERQAAEPDEIVWRLALSDFSESPALPKSEMETRKALQLRLRDAELRKDLALMVSICEQIANLPDSTLEEKLRHAQILSETNAPEERQTRIWEELLIEFPRAPAVQLAAANHFAKRGNTAQELECLKAAARLTPLPPEQSLRIANAKHTEKSQALENYLQLLQRTPPDPSPSKNPAPTPELMSTRPDVPRPSETDAQGSRLLALKGIGRLLQDSPTKWELIEPLISAADMESVWALWHVGETARSLDLLEKLVEEDPEPSRISGFVFLTLDAGDFARLKKWILKEPGDRWQKVSTGFGMMTASGWHPSFSDLQTLFKDAPAFARLRAAESLAASGQLRMALALGLPQDLPSQTLADAHLRTASWRLATRDPQGAIEDFKKGLDLARPSEDFDSPWIASLRALWLLMEPESRSALETATRERLSTEEHPGARLTAEALFSALRGDSTKFREAVDAWLLHKGWPLDGQGMPVLKAAAALETWHLSAQARELCRAALRSEAALPSLLGETGVHRALENSLILSLLLESGPARAQFLLNEWVARGAKKEELSSAGAKALGMGRVEIARLIQERAFQMEPTHIASWSQILALRSFEEGRSDVPLTWFLKAPASERSQIPQKTLSQWIFTLLSEGQFDKARQWLDVLPKEKPPGPLAIARVKLLMETEGKKAAQQAANAIPADSPAGREIATLLREPESSPPQSPALSNLIQKHQSSTILEELHQALANQKDSELPLIVSRFLTPGTLSPSVRRGAISVLMEHSKHSEALRILEMMDRDGLADHALALAYAECLWKIGRRAEALDIASAYDRIARVDPALRVSLAAFFLSVNRPDAALRQVEACAALPTISEPCAPLRSSIAKLMIDRGRLEDAKIQIALTAQTPGALSPTVLADFYKATTNLSAVSPQENEFSLGKNDQRAFVKEMAKRHLDLGNPDMALTWLASAPELAAQDEILKLVSELREASPAALTTYWESLIDSPRHAAREAAKSALAKLQPE